MPEQEGTDLRWILAVVRRWWWLIIGCALLAGIVAFFVTTRMKPEYEATVVLLVQPAQSNQGSEVSVLTAGERLALTYSQMVKGRSVLDVVIKNNQLNETPEQLAKRVKATPVSDTQLLRLTVTDQSPDQSVLLANGIAEAFIQYNQNLQSERYEGSLKNIEDKLLVNSTKIDELQSQIIDLKTQQNISDSIKAQLENMLFDYRSNYELLQLSENSTQDQLDEIKQQISNAQTRVATLATTSLQLGTEIENKQVLLDRAQNEYNTLHQDFNDMQATMVNAADAVIITEPASTAKPVDQNKLVYIGLAGLVSAALALGIAFLNEYLNDVIRTPEDVSRTIGLNPIGSISVMKDPEGGLIAITQPRSPAAESFRVLATNIGMSNLDKPLHTLLITSPNAREGKSLTVANLSVAFAQRETNVIAVDIDLRIPRLHQLFGLPQSKGLTGSLLDGSAAKQLKQVEKVERLRILPSGSLPPNPAEVIASGRMRKVLRELVQDADLLLVDCPPVLPVTDATILATMVDGVVLIVHTNQTHRRDLKDAVERLRNVDACLLGVVMNFMPNHKGRYYQYYQ
jgi:non-specific protein-tyrosine kinase